MTDMGEPVYFVDGKMVTVLEFSEIWIARQSCIKVTTLCSSSSFVIMKRKGPPPFCCGASRDMYLDYYTGKRQFGCGNMTVLISAKYQRGHGLGNIFRRLFRSILLLFVKGNAPSWAGKAVQTGLNLVHSASHRVPFKQSIKKHVPKALKSSQRRKVSVRF